MAFLAASLYLLSPDDWAVRGVETVDRPATASAPPRGAGPQPEELPSARALATPLPTDLAIQLRSATTPLSALALRLEGAGEPRALALNSRAELHGLPAGRYRLSGEERWWTTGALEFDLGARGGTRQVEYAMEALGPWRGRVLDARDASPLEHVRITWRVQGELGDMGYRAELGQREVQLLAGTFQVACGGYLARESQLTIEAPGFEPFRTPWIEFDGLGDLDLGDIALLAQRVSAAPIEGRVVAQENGRPISGVQVSAVDAAIEPQQLWMLRGELQGAAVLAQASAGTDEQGRFALEPAPSSSLRLVAFLPSRGLLISEVLQARGPHELRMPQGAMLRGRVVTTQALLAQGRIQGISIEASGRQTMLALDEGLRFELGGLAAGPVRVALQALEQQSGGQTVLAEVAVQSLMLADGEVADLELRYGVDAQPWWIEGRLQLPAEVEFPQLRAALWIEGQMQPSRFAVIDSGGQFRLEGAELPRAAGLFVGGTSADSSVACLAMRIVPAGSAPGQRQDFDLRVPAVRGSVWKLGEPATRQPLLVEALDAEAGWAAAVAEGLSLTSDRFGGFAIHGLVPGAYAIGRIGAARVHFQIAADSTQPLELRLE